MNEKTHVLPKAIIAKSRFSSLLWLIPISAGLLCAWYVCHDLIFAGPTITIYFQNAEGLQEQTSLVQYRGVKVGEVVTLRLDKERQSVAVKAKLVPSAANLARDGSVFWIVRPEIKLGAVTGLRTIVLGNYITVQPGHGARTNLFTGVETAPIEPIKALVIELHSAKLDSLQAESPIFYRGVQVGEVLDCRLSDDARDVVIRARIQEEYAPLVRLNSKFWNAGGINFHLGLFSGAKLSAVSAQTLVSGGISFATPPEPQSAATNGAVFVLNEKADTAWEKWAPVIPLRTVPETITNKISVPNLGSN